MADSYVELPQGGLGGKKLASESVLNGANTLDKQVVRHHAASRVQQHYYNLAITGVAAEALMSLTPVVSFITGAPATGFTVTAGKTFWVTRIAFTLRQTSTALNWGEINLRVNPVGAVLVTSAIALTKRLTNQAPTAIAGIGVISVINLADPLEIPAGAGWGISHRAAATTCELSVSINGFEAV